MIKVGITGGIGSGKTAFCKEWEALGAFVVYADDFAKKLMQEDEELKQKIIKAFGEHSYDENGNLNRAYLADEAFEKGRVEELNKLVHPVLRKRAQEIAEQKAKDGVQIFAKEAAILLNDGRPEDFDFVVLILAEKEKRLKRTTERDGTEEAKIRNRMNKQPDFDQKTGLADFVVLNNGTLEDLKIKAREIFKAIRKMNN